MKAKRLILKDFPEDTNTVMAESITLGNIYNQIALHEAITASSPPDWAVGSAQKGIFPIFDANKGKFVYDPQDWNKSSQKGTISDVHLILYKTDSDANASINIRYEISVICNCHFKIYYMKEDPKVSGSFTPEVPKPPPSLCFDDLTVFHNCTFEPITYFGVGVAFSKTLIAGVKYESSFEMGSPQSPSGITVRYKSPGGSDVLNPRIAADPTNMVSTKLQGIINQIAAKEADLYVPPSNLKS
jgi:hypothetical protein